MIDKNYFNLKEFVEKKIYEYDDQGNKYTKLIKGIVYQITNDFVVIDNGIYKEAFKYCQFEENQNMDTEDIPYDLSLESYSKDIIKECIDNIKKDGEGIVFNKVQLEDVLNELGNQDYSVEQKDKIFYIKINKGIDI